MYIIIPIMMIVVVTILASIFYKLESGMDCNEVRSPAGINTEPVGNTQEQWKNDPAKCNRGFLMKGINQGFLKKFSF